jgi:hypothetical protein
MEHNIYLVTDLSRVNMDNLLGIAVLHGALSIFRYSKEQRFGSWICSQVRRLEAPTL